jgi:hypothetical protein
VHALLGAFAVGLVGWGAFAALMVIFGLILLTLMTYDRVEGPATAEPTKPTKPEGGGSPLTPPVAPTTP